MDADTAFTLGVYWNCVSGISEDLAGMPWKVFARVAGGRSPAPDHPVDWILSTQSNEEMTSFEFRAAMFTYALTHGNAVAEVERDGAGRPVWLWPVEPWRVCLKRNPAGGLYYEVSNYGRQASALDPADVLHIKGMGDGLWGMSVLQYAAQQLGLAVTTEKHAGRLFANDGRPDLWIEKKGKLDEPARKRFREDWRRAHTKNPGDIAIMTGGDQVHPLDRTSPQDAQLIESRKFDGESICRWFRYPLYKAGFLDRATFSNIEQQSIEYTTNCLQPWAVRAEQQANLKLFGQKQRGTFYSKMNFNGLMRGDAESRAKFYSTMVGCGLMSPDEPRELEDLNPLPRGLGREHFVPKNWQTVDQAVNPPAPLPVQPPPPPAGDNPPPSGEKEPAPADPPADTSALRPVFRDAAGRVVRREAHRAADALKRLAADPDGMAAWRADFLAEHRQYVAKAFAPAAAALGVPPGGAGVALEVEGIFAAAAFGEAFDRLTGTPDPAALAVSWEAERGDWLADRVMARLTLAAHHHGSP